MHVLPTLLGMNYSFSRSVAVAVMLTCLCWSSLYDLIMKQFLTVGDMFTFVVNKPEVPWGHDYARGTLFLLFLKLLKKKDKDTESLLDFVVTFRG